jgi:phospholipase A1
MLAFAYTQKSFWQVFDASGSRPFRETNYNPEFFYRYGSSKSYFDLGIEHESNGEGEPKSRSWDRIFTRLMYLNNRFRIELKLWYVYAQDYYDPIFTERNNSMQHFMGHGDITLSVLMGNAIYKLLGRLNTSTGYGYHQHWLMYPIKGTLYFTLYYSQGYGESLRDYQKSLTSYGAGIVLNP